MAHAQAHPRFAVVESPATWDALTASLATAGLADLDLTWQFLCAQALVDGDPASRAAFEEIATRERDIEITGPSAAARVAMHLHEAGCTTELARREDPNASNAAPAFEAFDVLGQLRKLEAFFYKERELCASSDWDAFSRAKGNHRWIAGYLRRAAEVERQHDRPYAEQLLALVDRVTGDADYEEPEWARRRVRELLNGFLETL